MKKNRYYQIFALILIHISVLKASNIDNYVKKQTLFYIQDTLPVFDLFYARILVTPLHKERPEYYEIVKKELDSVRIPIKYGLDSSRVVYQTFEREEIKPSLNFISNRVEAVPLILVSFLEELGTKSSKKNYLIVDKNTIACMNTHKVLIMFFNDLGVLEKEIFLLPLEKLTLYKECSSQYNYIKIIQVH